MGKQNDDTYSMLLLPPKKGEGRVRIGSQNLRHVAPGHRVQKNRIF